MPWYQEHLKDITSQCGEDGLIERIFEIIGEGDRWCVEFGAFDGKTLSNTYNLIHNRAWSGVLIEADRRKFRRLQETYAGNPNATLLHKFVEFDGANTLDRILATTQIPRSFSFLSIDIDGNDYHVWKSVEVYQPRVIVIEFNPTIPTDIEFVQAKDMAVNQGVSLLALVKLGRAKGYELVATTKWNAFFVRNELFEKFELADNSPAALHDGSAFQTRVFQLYDGTLVLDGCKSLLWLGLDISPHKIQILPRFLRSFPAHPLVYLGVEVRNFLRRTLGSVRQNR
jgi:hypothetical protein